MTDTMQGVLTAAIIVFMGIAFGCCITKKDTNLCIWCVGVSFILAEVIF